MVGLRLKSVGNFLKAMDHLFYELAFAFAIFNFSGKMSVFRDIIASKKERKVLYLYPYRYGIFLYCTIQQRAFVERCIFSVYMCACLPMSFLTMIFSMYINLIDRPTWSSREIHYKLNLISNM